MEETHSDIRTFPNNDRSDSLGPYFLIGYFFPHTPDTLLSAVFPDAPSLLTSSHSTRSVQFSSPFCRSSAGRLVNSG